MRHKHPDLYAALERVFAQNLRTLAGGVTPRAHTGATEVRPELAVPMWERAKVQNMLPAVTLSRPGVACVETQIVEYLGGIWSPYTGRSLFLLVSSLGRGRGLPSGTLFQVSEQYLEALATSWRAAVLIEGQLLDGGLEPPSIPSDAIMAP